MSKWMQAIGEAMDDIRHELVERPMGREVRSSPLNLGKHEQGTPHGDGARAQVRSIDTNNPLSGIGTTGDGRSNWENVQDTVKSRPLTREDLYGRDGHIRSEFEKDFGLDISITLEIERSDDQRGHNRDMVEEPDLDR